MIVHTERRGGKVVYVDRAEYRFQPSFDDWGHFVVKLSAATDDELEHLESRHLMFRLREGATEEDVRSLAAHLDMIIEDVQMLWIDGPPGGGPGMPVVVPIREAA